MKKLKLFVFSLLSALVVLSACTNSDSFVEDLSDPQESAALRAAIEQLETLYDDQGNPISDQQPTGNLIFDFCFEFVYPIELIYNNGTTVTINGLQDLIAVIINQTPELFIVGIEYPFDVIVWNPASDQLEVITINNEAEFLDLLESCNFGDCQCPNIDDPVCVEIITGNGTTEIITFQNACFAECEGFTEDDFIECPNDCDCPAVFEPVCVMSAGAILQFDNFCLAQCAGFDQGDLVDCPNDCGIFDLEVEVGECNNDGTYNIILNFEVQNPGNDFFAANGNILGTFAIAELPVTIENYPQTGEPVDFAVVCINDQPNCCADVEWQAPDCNSGGDCAISNLQVEVGDCNPAANGTYPLTINFDVENPGNDFFDVFVRNEEYIGTYLIADLPVTIEEFEVSGLPFDFVEVCINDVQNCCAETEWESPACNADCNCPATFDPVCVEAGNTIITYQNECYAICDGWTPNNFVNCPSDCLDCMNEPYDPVCVELNGAIITYYNACLALCDGFTPNDFINCN